MKNGDIFKWVWKPELGKNDLGWFGSYYCYSQIAVFKNGKLFDTYWGMNSRILDPESVDLTYLGNKHEMTEIRESDLPYYRTEDIVSMRHPNATNAPIYLKAGAEKNVDVMKRYARMKMNDAMRERDFAIRQIVEQHRNLELIEAGEIEKVFF